MKYRILIIILFFLSFSTANAQWFYHFSDNQNRHPGSEDLQLMKVDVQLGTSFISSFAGSPMISSYIAPTLNFNIFPHFNLNVGGILMNNHTSVFNQFVSRDMEQGILPGRLNSDFALFTSGNYLISNKLLVYGSACTSIFSANNYSPYQLSASTFRKIILTGLHLAQSTSSLTCFQLAHRWNTVTDLILTTTGSITTDDLILETGVSIHLFFGNPVTSHIGINIWDRQE